MFKLNRVLKWTILSSSLLLASNAFASGFFYGGLNTGASFVSNSSADTYWSQNVTVKFRDNSSQQGYNGGAHLGYNFLSHSPYLLALELSGNVYSNVGHYNIDFSYPNAVTNPNFAVDFDLNYSLHLALRPGFLINESTLLYFKMGAGYARYSKTVKNLVSSNVGNNPREFHDNGDAFGLTLGAGLEKQLTEHFGVFVAYEYTHYGAINLKKLVQSVPVFIDQDPPLVQPEEGIIPQGYLQHRHANLDASVFKMGVTFRF